MADLNAILNNIATAVYGEDVRSSIYDGIKFINDQYMTIQTVAERVQGLINTYDEAVSQAKELTGALKTQIQTGTNLKNDLSDLNSALANANRTLENLKSENATAQSAITEAREKIPILQDLLAKIPDLDNASEIATQLETSYQNAKDALDRLNDVSGTIQQLTQLNSGAESNLDRYDQTKSEIDELVQKTTELENVVANYPEIVQALQDVYQSVTETTVDLEELKRLLNELDGNATIINENKEAVGTVAQNIESIKKLSEMDLSGLASLDSRVTILENNDLTPRVEKIEETLAGLAETLEALI